MVLSRSVVWLEKVSQSVSYHRLAGSISQSADRLEFSSQTADWLKWRHGFYHRLAEIFKLSFHGGVYIFFQTLTDTILSIDIVMKIICYKSFSNHKISKLELFLVLISII